MYTKRQAMNEAKAAIASYEIQTRDLLAESAKLEQVVVDAQQTLAATLRELAEHLVPSMEKSQVERVCAELGSSEAQGVLHRADRLFERNQRRIANIEQDKEYVDRGQLLHPEQGPYIQVRDECLARVAAAEAEVAKYEFKAFYWLLGREYHVPKQQSGFQSFMRTVALVDYREKRALAEVEQHLGHHDFAVLAQNFQVSGDLLAQAQAALTDVESKINYILELLEVKKTLEIALVNHERDTIELLRATVVKTFKAARLAHVHDRIRPAARPLIAKAAAQIKKKEYCKDLVHYLELEANDRARRIRAIKSVLPKWNRKPFGLIRSKSKWLVELPQAKREGTEKRLNWIRTMRFNIAGFSDYHAFSVLMHEMGEALLPYDVFGMAAGTRMPHESFTRALITELDLYRETFRQVKADYRSYRRVVVQHDRYVESDWTVWDEDDYYEDQVAESMASEWDPETGRDDIS